MLGAKLDLIKHLPFFEAVKPSRRNFRKLHCPPLRNLKRQKFSKGGEKKKKKISFEEAEDLDQAFGLSVLL